ncbi:unnamed protein product [Ilex paraguariensis]|uniref:Uncharacterized protein n=1 Tax=Ilex paraguariensis TaxID=185542 RepID=A0ABC8R1Z3_9AQUA
MANQGCYFTPSIPGVPVIIGLRNALLLEQPPAFQHQFAISAEKERLHMTELEYQMLNMGKTKLVTEEARDSSDFNEGVEDQISGSQVSKTNKARGWM